MLLEILGFSFCLFIAEEAGNTEKLTGAEKNKHQQNPAFSNQKAREGAA